MKNKQSTLLIIPPHVRLHNTDKVPFMHWVLCSEDTISTTLDLERLDSPITYFNGVLTVCGEDGSVLARWANKTNQGTFDMTAFSFATEGRGVSIVDDPESIVRSFCSILKYNVKRHGAAAMVTRDYTIMSYGIRKRTAGDIFNLSRPSPYTGINKTIKLF